MEITAVAEVVLHACLLGRRREPGFLYSIPAFTHTSKKFGLWLLALKDTLWESAFLKEAGVRKESQLSFFIYSDHFDLGQCVALIFPNM